MFEIEGYEVMRRISGAKRETATEFLRKLHTVDLHNIYSLC
jgi:hypothetical protein